MKNEPKVPIAKAADDEIRNDVEVEGHRRQIAMQVPDENTSGEEPEVEGHRRQIAMQVPDENTSGEEPEVEGHRFRAM